MSKFYFALINPEAQSLFKEEVSLRYPQLRLSYNKKGFYTFKSETEVDFYPLFCRVSGEMIGKYRLSDLCFSRAWVWKISDDLQIPQHLQELTERSSFKIGEKVTLIIMVSSEDFWVGEYTLNSQHFQTPGEVSSILEKDVPSRAYYKLAEVFESFDLVFDDFETVLELGSAPGGASVFLLDQGFKVIGVDPAEMDPEILRSKSFKHLKRAFETLDEKDFHENVDWIISDINLPPQVVLNQVHRLLKFLNPRGIILTLKINEDKHLLQLDNFVLSFKKVGFKKVKLKYLPSHRKEITLIALHP